MKPSIVLRTAAGAIGVAGGLYLAMSGLILAWHPPAFERLSPTPASLVAFGALLVLAGVLWLVEAWRRDEPE